MRLRRRILFTAAAILVALFLTPSAQAVLANRVFVSARSGNDANPCNNILTPCQTFAGAVVQLNPGGEAIVLDWGGYGTVTITQAVTIEAPPGGRREAAGSDRKRARVIGNVESVSTGELP